MNTLRSQITPLLEDFKRADGKGSITTANQALIKMVEVLVSHIERTSFNWNWTNPLNPAPNAAAAAPNPTQHWTGVVGYVPPVQGWPVAAAPQTGWNTLEGYNAFSGYNAPI